ncbi:MAG: [Clostridia bacterium]|nr:[FeFe] hydrogenase H-cluster radical SAM maturase HydE [Clostridia bacterium]
MDINKLVDKLYCTQDATDEELSILIDTSEQEYLFKRAMERRYEYYGRDVYIRGLIEFTNYCKNNCYYCGIRCDNKNLTRYRLTEDEILDCAKNGYDMGFRTFVLQGGEDGYFTNERICSIVSKIKQQYPDCAITLSVGEKSYESYKAFYEAGATRYLLRHETATQEHYSKLHPQNMSFKNRIECIKNLKKIGYQTGSGFMVGSPYQTLHNLVLDLRFLQEIEPDMIGIGPFLSHNDTPFANHENGSLKRCINIISILRLMFPYALIPSTTALGTIHPQGRVMGLMAGANVVMPNLSPSNVRKLYTLYDNKACTGVEAAEGLTLLKKQIASANLEIKVDRGDVNR